MEPTDLTTILAVNAEICADPSRPTIKQFKPLDPVDVEVTLLEADHLIEEYFEQYRSRFVDPMDFEALREVYRQRFREHILGSVELVKTYAEPETR